MRRRGVLIAFLLFAVLAILGLFVLHDAAAGMASLAAMIVFIVACMLALRRQEGDSATGAERTGLNGFFGHWF